MGTSETSLIMQELAQRLSGDAGEESAQLFRALLCELVAGSPVSRERLSELMGWPVNKVSAALEQAPGVEYDSAGHIIGYGLTLRETPHAFEVDGRRLYTWCALDALIFPSLVGNTAQVFSSCAATRAPVRLTVTPDGIRDLDPAGAMVSLVPPDASADVRSAFCCHVHFFASAAAADAWAGAQANVAIVSVHDAFRLGQSLVQRLSAPTLSSCGPACAEAHA